MKDLIICLVAWIDFDLWPELSLGFFPVLPITFTARPRRSAKLDGPGHSDLAFEATLGRWGVTFETKWLQL